MLYPFKFKPVHLDKIWGGHTIMKWYNDVPAACENVGETWVISDEEKYPTQVSNGPHAGDDLKDIIEVYMDELVGGKVYEAFGNRFPLLMKFIDAVEDLSVQVHPNDEFAIENENSLGKTEMWYMLPAKGKPSIYLGWNQPMNVSLIHASIADGTLVNYLEKYDVHEGDVAMLPAGTVHALCKDTIVAEIQENSDVTYRLYDYNRIADGGKKRPLHLDKALKVMDLQPKKEELFKRTAPRINGVVNLQQTDYFTVNLLSPMQPIQRDYAPLDSFVAYMCVEGACEVTALDCESEENKTASLRLGEAVLIPAVLNDIVITPQGHCKLLEIYLEK